MDLASELAFLLVGAEAGFAKPAVDPISLLSHAKLLPCNELREFGGKWKGMAIRVYYHAYKRHLLHLMSANTYMYSFNRKHFCSPTESMHVNPLHSPASENITKA